MTAANYDACYDKTLACEGGYQCDPNDSGNWTGCAVGSGQLKGTNKGISACAYPDLDIANLDDETIESIYHDDYWMKCGGDDCPMGVDLCSFDGTVNSGPGYGVLWLQQAIGMPSDQCDGAYGPITQGYVKDITDADGVIDRMCDLRLAFLKSLDTWSRYGEGWSNRVADIRATAHAMAQQTAPAPTPPPVTAPQLVTLTISIEITAPPGADVGVAIARG